MFTRRLARISLVLATSILSGCGGVVGLVAPAEQTGPNGVNLDGAIVSRGTLHASCSIGDGYLMSGNWDEDPGFYSFGIGIRLYKGPGTYMAKDFAYVMPFGKANGLLVAQGSTNYAPADVLGSVTVNSDEKSGRFDQNFLTPDRHKFRLHGRWQCDTIQR